MNKALTYFSNIISLVSIAMLTVFYATLGDISKTLYTVIVGAVSIILLITSTILLFTDKDRRAWEPMTIIPFIASPFMYGYGTFTAIGDAFSYSEIKAYSLLQSILFAAVLLIPSILALVSVILMLSKKNVAAYSLAFVSSIVYFVIYSSVAVGYIYLSGKTISYFPIALVAPALLLTLTTFIAMIAAAVKKKALKKANSVA